MATAALNVVYNAIGSIGIKFDRHYIRETVNFHGGLNDSCEYGVLWDERNTTITKERLADVLTIAKNRQVCLITFPNVRESKTFWKQKKEVVQTASNEIFVCFIQKGVLDTALDGGARLRKSVNQSFMYFQEDEKALELERLLIRMNEELSAFQKRALNSDFLESNATNLLRYIENEGAMLRAVLVEDYIEDSTYKFQSQCVRSAIQCLGIVCSGSK